ncbi:MAG: DNA cytosine methyltransferase, partial [Candidatus Methanoplasma sp.]|nr:DNA cytosine methyltransferase [Candidatus Methanoplasma sp.]
MASPKKHRMGELFSGPGGIALGADIAAAASAEYGKVEIEHAWASDFDRDACETYRNNVKIDCKDVHCMDVRKLDTSA